MCKRNSPHKNEATTGYVKENPSIRIKEARTGCVRTTARIKKKQAWDV